MRVSFNTTSFPFNTETLVFMSDITFFDRLTNIITHHSSFTCFHRNDWPHFKVSRRSSAGGMARSFQTNLEDLKMTLMKQQKKKSRERGKQGEGERHRAPMPMSGF